jgi:hypothetical protein
MTTGNFTPIQPGIAGASGRTFILRPVTSTDPKTGAISVTNLVEPPEELEAAWNCLNIANSYISQADQLLGLTREQLKTLPAEHGLPVRHLYCHAIELYLKAFLRAEGVTNAEIRDNRTYGHRLEDLYTECKSRGLVLNSADTAFFDPMLRHHLKAGHEEYQFRYFDKSFQTADPDLIRAAGHVIARVAGAHVDNLLRELREQAVKDGKQVVSLAKKLFISVGAGTTPEGKVPVTISVGSRPP